MKGRFLPTRNLDSREVQLIPEALSELAKARWEVSFKRSEAYLPQAIANNSRRDIPAALLMEARHISGVIEGLARRTPWKSTCLVRSLAAFRMLKRRGIPAVLHLGVYTKPQPHSLGAHAWVSLDNEVLVGGGRLERYTEIARLY